jgi:hypothetical protein
MKIQESGNTPMENDIVLIYIDDEPLAFARIEEIRPDVKKDWFIIKLLMLQIPLKAISWILKADYINGSPFSMNGQMVRMEKVLCPPDDQEWEDDPGEESQTETKGHEEKGNKPTGSGGEVISFAQHQRSKK